MGKHSVPRTEEHKRKLSEVQKGRVLTEDHKSKLRGRKVSEETRAKISKAVKGRKVSEETKRRLSEAHKGKVLTEETKAKIGKANRSEAWNHVCEIVRLRVEEKLSLQKIAKRFNCSEGPIIAILDCVK